jgi:DNA-binding NtrC family response regulator
VLQILKTYHWPGNVRELKNMMYRAFIMADDIIDISCLPNEFGAPKPAPQGSGLTMRVGGTIAEMERTLIMATLEKCGGHKEKAAEVLGLSPKTLYNRLRQYEEENQPVQ